MRPQLLFAALCMLLAVAFSSCGPGPAPEGDRNELPSPAAGPVTVRVLISPGAVTDAEMSGTQGCKVSIDNREVARSHGPVPVTVRRRGDAWLIDGTLIRGSDAIIEPVSGGYLRLEPTAYRGSFRLVAADDGRFYVTNHLDMESYLAGVLACELYANWHDETYQALAVAARTFALYHVRNTGPGRAYDLGDDQGSQVYGGVARETDRSRRAVNATRGQVLAWVSGGRQRIFMTQYSAACGGHVNGARVLRNAPDLPPLNGGQVCNDCRDCGRYRWPNVRVAKSELYRALRACYRAAGPLGGVKEVRVASSEPHGRAIWVDVIGTTGQSMRVRAEDIRLALLRSGSNAGRGLFSMNCEIVDAGDAIEFRNGKGFGHGVGLCQWGAQGKAQRGWTSRQILSFYYPGASIVTLY
jgi:stage II sporulation protein D